MVEGGRGRLETIAVGWFGGVDVTAGRDDFPFSSDVCLLCGQLTTVFGSKRLETGEEKMEASMRSLTVRETETHVGSA